MTYEDFKRWVESLGVPMHISREAWEAFEELRGRTEVDEVWPAVELWGDVEAAGGRPLEELDLEAWTAEVVPAGPGVIWLNSYTVQEAMMWEDEGAPWIEDPEVHRQVVAAAAHSAQLLRSQGMRPRHDVPPELYRRPIAFLGQEAYSDAWPTVLVALPEGPPQGFQVLWTDSDAYVVTLGSADSERLAHQVAAEQLIREVVQRVTARER